MRASIGCPRKPNKPKYARMFDLLSRSHGQCAKHARGNLCPCAKDSVSPNAQELPKMPRRDFFCFLWKVCLIQSGKLSDLRARLGERDLNPHPARLMGSLRARVAAVDAPLALRLRAGVVANLMPRGCDDRSVDSAHAQLSRLRLPTAGIWR